MHDCHERMNAVNKPSVTDEATVPMFHHNGGGQGVTGEHNSSASEHGRCEATWWHSVFM